MNDSRSTPRAWLLNLDAEIELASPKPYTRRRALQKLVEERRQGCASLCQGEPVVGVDRVAPECSVYCWCPTPSALAELRALALSPVRGASLAVLRAVNHRAWPLPFAPAFPGRSFLSPGSSWREHLAPGSFPFWKLKRPYGFAGRGQRRVGPDPSPDDVRWIDDSLRQGGLLVEPAVRVVREFSTHGHVDAGGLLLGSTCAFRCDDTGSLDTIELAERDSTRDRALKQTATTVAEQLARAGYFGPFGTDAFEYERNGSVHLNALSEVNARFTLGWSLGMGREREAALGRYARGR